MIGLCFHLPRRSAVGTATILLTAVLFATSATAQKGPSKVDVVELAQEDVPYSTTLPGRAVAFDEIDIRPRVIGIISEVAYEAGRQHEEGALLFRIEGDTHQAEAAADVRETCIFAVIRFLG